MLALKIKVERDPKMGKRRFENACKAGFAAVGAYWHSHVLPRHFEYQAKFRYQYRPRSRKYKERKERLAAKGQAQQGGKVDLVLTGLMQRTMTQFATIQPYPTRATVRVQAPRYMTVRPRNSNQPDKFAELSRIDREDLRGMERILKKTIQEELSK